VGGVDLYRHVAVNPRAAHPDSIVREGLKHFFDNQPAGQRAHSDGHHASRLTPEAALPADPATASRYACALCPLSVERCIAEHGLSLYHQTPRRQAESRVSRLRSNRLGEPLGLCQQILGAHTAVPLGSQHQYIRGRLVYPRPSDSSSLNTTMGFGVLLEYQRGAHPESSTITAWYEPSLSSAGQRKRSAHYRFRSVLQDF